MTLLVLGALQFFLGAFALLLLGANRSSILLLAIGSLSVSLAIWLTLNSRIDALHALMTSNKPM